MQAPTALIADDEPLLRERLAGLLGRLWPELQVVAQARNGSEALQLFEQHQPKIAFLDVHMPGMSGIDVARAIGKGAELVFVTAYDRYAVEAFARGAVDYLVKPLDPERLSETVQRLRTRLAAPADKGDLDATLEAIARQLRERMGGAARESLKWIKASVGSNVRLIPVDEVVYFKSDAKYTLVVWQGGEAVIRKSIKELADELDEQQFAQIHRSTIVNLRSVAQFTQRDDAGEVQLKGRDEKLVVSRSYLPLFQRM
ncbi:LytR/AlgR family response regulator transcription factor [Ramlibacter albus]|uniref:Response regulator transcription factor n=1 Tax=Ramlibacter albus TaxID=2079448 RepID=A0A923MB61_9BURK|nr:LytTR family DNA-binding domain-containing protein [Ramlibacter albus]MBC5766286.1 response regulator transcription factor [Ramlibacter albus]